MSLASNKNANEESPGTKIASVSHGGTGFKRSRSAKVHNFSERVRNVGRLHVSVFMMMFSAFNGCIGTSTIQFFDRVKEQVVLCHKLSLRMTMNQVKPYPHTYSFTLSSSICISISI